MRASVRVLALAVAVAVAAAAPRRAHANPVDGAVAVPLVYGIIIVTVVGGALVMGATLIADGVFAGRRDPVPAGWAVANVSVGGAMTAFLGTGMVRFADDRGAAPWMLGFLGYGGLLLGFGSASLASDARGDRLLGMGLGVAGAATLRAAVTLGGGQRTRGTSILQGVLALPGVAAGASWAAEATGGERVVAVGIGGLALAVAVHGFLDAALQSGAPEPASAPPSSVGLAPLLLPRGAGLAAVGTF